ncbi:hypothetical protein [Kiloniella sp.]|uniref:hypothetical protein n=1 Tax=Kiloniella sp. TaxID=1938587 RepID=UPI003A9424EE
MTDDENTLVFEAKVGRNNNFDDDFSKLKGMTDQGNAYRYDFGIHIHFKDQSKVAFNVFEDGAVSDNHSILINKAWTAYCHERGVSD